MISSDMQNRLQVISPAGILMAVFFIPVTYFLPGFNIIRPVNYLNVLPHWVKILLLFPSGKLVPNPVIRMSVTFASLSLLVFLLLDIHGFAVQKRSKYLVRELCIWIIAVFLVVIPALWIMQLRSVEGRQTNSHDGGILQTEEAMDMLMHGRNPYTEDYTSPYMKLYAKACEIDEPLYHNPYLPASFILPLPFYWLGDHFLGTYDQHFFYVLCYVIMLFVLRTSASGEQRLAMLAGVGLNPAMVWFLFRGRNDIVLFLGLILAVRCIESRKVITAGISLGCILAFKQLSWIAVPFVWLYILDRIALKSRRIQLVIVTLLVFSAFLLPFIVWDAPALYDDTIAFNAGTTTHAYKIGGTPGYGFSNLILYWGLVDDLHAYFPFWIPIALFAVPLLFWLIRIQKRCNSRSVLMANIAILTFVVAFFSRFFHDNYIVLISMLLTVSYLSADSTGVVEKPDQEN